VGERSAALHVSEHAAPGAAEPTAEQADRVDLGVVRAYIAQSQARVLEISRVAEASNTQFRGLRAVADLATGPAGDGADID
jgi:hypothetical protein